MQLHPLAQQLLIPDRQAIIFASKGVISMALALFVSMYLQLDRPYWALVSAVFLQLRPESGLVIEKGLCQIAGSLVGGGVGLFILAVMMPYPILALGCLTVWVGLNSAASSMVHNTNYIYGFAMAGMTAALVVVMVMADASTASSLAAFDIAQSRISEITVGAICAMLVSQLLWPLSVKDSLRGHARTVINQSLQYLILELGSVSTHKQRHVHSDQVFEALVALNDDSSAVNYEGPEGPGRGRAANLLCQKVLSLLAVAQSLGRFHRNQPEQVSPAFRKLLKLMRQYFEQIAAATSYEAAYPLAQELRREILEHRATYNDESPVVTRLTQTALDLVADLVMILKAYNALEEHDRSLLKSEGLQSYRDPLIGAVNGFRTAVVFMLGAFVWVQTASQAAVMMMIMPVVFSMMFARFHLQLVTVMLKRILTGVLVAIPVALFVGLGILSQSSSDFEMLVLVLAGPYFIGLLALPNRATLSYGMGFCIPFTIIVQPSNHMVFQVDTAVSTALGLLVGISVLYWVFKLISPPDGEFMQRRLLKATAKDLLDIKRHADQDNWFNTRMGERLLRLANYDQAKNSSERYMTGLGLTGLNLGHVIMRMQRLLQPYSDDNIGHAADRWRKSLAAAYLASSKGVFDEDFPLVCARLLELVEKRHAGLESLSGRSSSKPFPQALNQPRIIEGMFQNLTLTFQRTANAVAEARARENSGSQIPAAA